MVTYPSYSLSVLSAKQLVSALSERFDRVYGPVAASDGTCRLLPLDQDASVPPGKLCRLPLKKLLLPANEPVWQYRSGSYQRTGQGEKIAVIGLPICELQGAWYLDQVFADNDDYRQHRAGIVLFGAPCEPVESCGCSEQMPVSGDYFITNERLWVLGENRKILPELQQFLMGDCEYRPLPLPVPSAKRPVPMTREQFATSHNSSVWVEESRRCLSCGACSALCPTCYCYDLFDDVAPNGEIRRSRAWDNCFFPEHGVVAGGYDFRASRAERLRFRYEHKKLGFGPMVGVNACVGCGRCDAGCPVGISLERVSELFMTEKSDVP